MAGTILDRGTPRRRLGAVHTTIGTTTTTTVSVAPISDVLLGPAAAGVGVAPPRTTGRHART